MVSRAEEILRVADRHFVLRLLTRCRGIGLANSNITLGISVGRAVFWYLSKLGDSEDSLLWSSGQGGCNQTHESQVEGSLTKFHVD